MFLDKLKSNTEAVVWGVGGSLLAGVVLFLDRSPAPMSKIAFDAAHVLISAVVGLIVLRLSKRLFSAYFTRVWYHYWVALVGVVVIGGGFEALQRFTGGDPSFRDLIRDVIGGTSALVFAYSFDNQSPSLRFATLKKGIGIPLSILLLALILYPNLTKARALWLKRAEFPVLQSNEYEWERFFFRASNGAMLDIVSPPHGFITSDVKVAKVVYGTTNGPGLSLDDVVGNWSGFESLNFNVYSSAEMPIEVILSIHDLGPRETFADHCNMFLTIHPGNNSFSIPIEEIRTNPKTRVMDIQNIISIVIFRLQPTESVTLYFDKFSLE